MTTKLREQRTTGVTARIRRAEDLEDDDQVDDDAGDDPGDDSASGSAGDDLVFEGHAAVFNQRTWIGPSGWGFWEQIDRGFFDDVLEDRAAFLVNHDPNIILARSPDTMTLSTDDVGLVPEARWDSADPDAVKWAGRVRRGDANEMSFAFTVASELWEYDEDTGEETRTLIKAEQLFDVSLVTYPAYEGTDGAMRADMKQAEAIARRHRNGELTVARPKLVTSGFQRGGDLRDKEAVLPPAAALEDDRSAQIIKLRHRITAARLGLPLN